MVLYGIHSVYNVYEMCICKYCCIYCMCIYCVYKERYILGKDVRNPLIVTRRKPWSKEPPYTFPQTMPESRIPSTLHRCLHHLRQWELSGLSPFLRPFMMYDKILLTKALSFSRELKATTFCDFIIEEIASVIGYLQFTTEHRLLVLQS